MSEVINERLNTPSYINDDQGAEIANGLNEVVATTFALYVKTKNFHWHMSGPHFRDYHLLFDEHAAVLIAMVDPLAERSRKLGQPTLKSVGQIADHQVIEDDNREYVKPYDMLKKLMEDNRALNQKMLDVHGVCDEYKDVATASILEDMMDQTERRIWFLFETMRGSNQ